MHYAFDISRNQTVLAQNAEQPLAVDLQFLSTEEWQYAIDTSTLTFHNNPPPSGQLPSPVFDAGLPPFTITVVACPIEWNLAGDTFVTSPPINPTCTGAPKNITLWPYGVREPNTVVSWSSNVFHAKATKLRIGEFPRLLSKGEHVDLAACV